MRCWHAWDDDWPAESTTLLSSRRRRWISNGLVREWRNVTENKKLSDVIRRSVSRLGMLFGAVSSSHRSVLGLRRTPEIRQWSTWQRNLDIHTPTRRIERDVWYEQEANPKSIHDAPETFCLHHDTPLKDAPCFALPLFMDYYSRLRRTPSIQG